MTKILIIADDLGIDSLTNERITDCYEKGLISSTSVMVTMPGFEEAVQWYKRQSLEPKLGIHLDLDGGKPVSDAFRIAKIVVRLAKKYGGVRIRVAGNVLYPSAFHKQVYRSLLNNYFKKHSNPLNHIPNFARLEKFMVVNPTINGDSIELMTHPGMEQDYKLLNSQAFLDFLKNYSLIRQEVIH